MNWRVWFTEYMCKYLGLYCPPELTEEEKWELLRQDIKGTS